MINQTYEPIRSIYAPYDGSAYHFRAILGDRHEVDYGHSDWPSRSYWIVPGTIREEAHAK